MRGNCIGLSLHVRIIYRPHHHHPSSPMINAVSIKFIENHLTIEAFVVTGFADGRVVVVYYWIMRGVATFLKVWRLGMVVEGQPGVTLSYLVLFGLELEGRLLGHRSICNSQGTMSNSFHCSRGSRSCLRSLQFLWCIEGILQLNSLYWEQSLLIPT